MDINVRFLFDQDGVVAVSEDGTVFPFPVEDALKLLHGTPITDVRVSEEGRKARCDTPPKVGQNWMTSSRPSKVTAQSR